MDIRKLQYLRKCAEEFRRQQLEWVEEAFHETTPSGDPVAFRSKQRRASEHATAAKQLTFIRDAIDKEIEDARSRNRC